MATEVIRSLCPSDGFMSATSPWDGQKFDVIYEDAPWKYKNWSDKAHGAAIAHYKTMKTEDIIALDVARYAADECIYYMWATWPKLRDAFWVVEHMCKKHGFDYVSGFPWIKYVPSYADGYLLEKRPDGAIEIAVDRQLDGEKAADYKVHPQTPPDAIGKSASVGGTPFHVKQGTGFVVYQCSEPLLILRRGPGKQDRSHQQVGLLHSQDLTFWHPIGKHSKKPICLREQIVREHPTSRRLELFATDVHPDWTSWGQKVGSILTPEGVVYEDRGLSAELVKQAGLRANA